VLVLWWLCRFWGLSDCLTVGAGGCCFADWRLAHAGVKAAAAPRRAASPRLQCRRPDAPRSWAWGCWAAVILILQLRKARAVFAYRSALDPRENGEHAGVLVSDLRLRLLNTRQAKSLLRPRLCASCSPPHRRQCSRLPSAARGPSPTSASLLCRRPAMPVPACLEAADNPWFNYEGSDPPLTGSASSLLPTFSSLQRPADQSRKSTADSAYS
jgi:hypothetical protein